jgi:HAD superfamily hydrolase (TIGR01509 family)
MPDPSTPRSHHPYRAVILDVDGTLIDSNAAHVEAWVEALREHGFDIAAAEIWPHVGKGGDQLLPAVAGLDSEEGVGKQVAERRQAIFQGRLATLRAFPGAHELVARLHDEGRKLVVASSSQPEEVGKLLDLARVTDLLDDIVSAGDAESSKPAPDIVQAALDRLGLPPGEAVMLGDTPYDIQAAGKTGVGVIAFRCGGFADEALEGALAIYDGPEDLLARYDESLLALPVASQVG